MGVFNFKCLNAGLMHVNFLIVVIALTFIFSKIWVYIVNDSWIDISPSSPLVEVGDQVKGGVGQS